MWSARVGWSFASVGVFRLHRPGDADRAAGNRADALVDELLQAFAGVGLGRVDVAIAVDGNRPEDYAHLPPGKARREITDRVMDAVAALSGQERADAYNERPAPAAT
jgi:hypothetical protein